jgi:hypothetical protein
MTEILEQIRDQADAYGVEYDCGRHIVTRRIDGRLTFDRLDTALRRASKAAYHRSVEASHLGHADRAAALGKLETRLQGLRKDLRYRLAERLA